MPDRSRRDHLQLTFCLGILFALDYKKTTKSENQMDCDHITKRQDGKVCMFHAESLGNCSPEKTKGKYGYPERRPCVFLKLNKVGTFWYGYMGLLINPASILRSEEGVYDDF